ncbi:MAG TPA: universal stress protein [Deltaproteobacteria bacterium]|nr:universal stress protein [Deltaproteobacteria bacterium]HOM27984.1 universal stress protein [Deltaproteobacteria bacterium]HPP79939.1 universal stress protein [Deltaproteobacteria bacterium]
MKKSKVKKPQKILCYIDFAKSSAYVVEYAHKLACLLEAELFVLHTVTDIRSAAGFYVPHINTDKLEEEVVKAAKDKMYAICSQVGDECVDARHRLVTRGVPIEAINKVIKEKEIDLLVVGHEVSTGALKSFKGDQAEKFMKNPTIPFLVLPV